MTLREHALAAALDARAAKRDELADGAAEIACELLELTDDPVIESVDIDGGR